jgi:phosphatidylinositol alpha-1,6-mannosyltransferase
VKSLLLTTNFPPAVGGLERFAHEAARALEPADVVVLAPAAPGGDSFDASAPFRVARFERSSASIGYFGALRLLRRNLERSGAPDAPALRRLGMPILGRLLANRTCLRAVASQSRALPREAPAPDVIQASSALPSGVLAALVGARRGAPYVVYTHGAELLAWRSPRRLGMLLARVLRDAALVGAVSRFTVQLVRSFGVPDSRIRLLPPGIDPVPFRSSDGAGALRARFGLGGRRVILTHGRLDPRKGHDVVLRALRRVVDARPDVVYLITGDGPNESLLRETARAAGLGGHVVFGGRIEERDVAALYHASDVFVMASRRIGNNVEGFGIVCLEAAAAARPVIAGRSGGVSDAVKDGETGYLVDPNDPVAIADRVLTLLGDPGLARRLGEAGRARVEAEFTRDAFAERVRAFLREAHATAGSGRAKSP